MLESLNSPVIYLICGGIILFVFVLCVILLIRSYRAGIKLGMDKRKLTRVIASSATFSVFPSIGILLGVVALSGSLGTPWPWLRLSVIGALHYETQVAQAAAEAAGIGGLSAENMNAEAFATIALLMSVCIMWGMILSFFFNKKYTDKLKTSENDTEKSRKPGFGDTAMAAMFIGLISAYLGSYIGNFISGNGMINFEGDITPILVSAVSALVMAFFTFLVEKKHLMWLDSISVACSMFVGMIVAVIF